MMTEKRPKSISFCGAERLETMVPINLDQSVAIFVSKVTMHLLGSQLFAR